MKNLKINALQIDLARQKENLPYIFSYIDFASQNGYNTLLVYLENAVRTKSTSFFNEDDTYSEDEILKIVEYAEKKNIDVIPALETLDHLEKFMAYPEFKDIGEDNCQALGRDFHNKDTCGCVCNSKFYQLVDTYTTEVSALFKSKYLHVGLDEPFYFTACDKCQERIKNGESAKKLFFDHVVHMHELCTSLGKRMMMWDDFFEYFDVVSELPKDIVMCNWNYMFMADQPLGHWVNRIAKDWFAMYDKLGIDYIYCTNVHRASSTYAMDSFYDYAKRYNPLGSLSTAWERSTDFYLGAYPGIAYWGRLIAGKITKEQKIDVYTEILDGNREIAELISSLNIVDAGGYGQITEKCETDYLIKRIYRDSLAYALPKFKQAIDAMKDGRAKDIIINVYLHVFDQYLKLLMQRSAVDYFEGGDRKKILNTVSYVKNGYREIKDKLTNLWPKYRDGIKSSENSFELQYANIEQNLEENYKKVQEDKEFGILYVELMLPEGYGTPRSKVQIEYEDGEIATVYNGILKHSIVSFEFGGCFQYRFAIKMKKIKKLIFTALGEGCTYPTFFRYSIGKNIYVIDTVKKLYGNVINEDKLLRNDSRFAEMGYDDGVAHALDITLCKVESAIEVTFKEFV